MNSGRHAHIASLAGRLFAMKLAAVILAGGCCGSSVVLGIRDGSPVYLAAACLGCLVTLISALV